MFNINNPKYIECITINKLTDEKIIELFNEHHFYLHFAHILHEDFIHYDKIIIFFNDYYFNSYKQTKNGIKAKYYGYLHQLHNIYYLCKYLKRYRAYKYILDRHEFYFNEYNKDIITRSILEDYFLIHDILSTISSFINYIIYPRIIYDIEQIVIIISIINKAYDYNLSKYEFYGKERIIMREIYSTFGIYMLYKISCLIIDNNIIKRNDEIFYPVIKNIIKYCSNKYPNYGVENFLIELISGSNINNFENFSFDILINDRNKYYSDIIKWTIDCIGYIKSKEIITRNIDIINEKYHENMNTYYSNHPKIYRIHIQKALQYINKYIVKESSYIFSLIILCSDNYYKLK